MKIANFPTSFSQLSGPKRTKLDNKDVSQSVVQHRFVLDFRQIAAVYNDGDRNMKGSKILSRS